MTTLTMNPDARVARPLRVLIPLIKEELAAGWESGMPHYRRAGDLLIEAKPQVPAEEWPGWVQHHFGISRRTAERYIALAHESAKGGSAKPFRARTLSELDGDLRTWADRTKLAGQVAIHNLSAGVNVKRLTEERQSREQEAKLIRELALRLIDIGYKVLARKLHPDKGGSHAAMTRLNKVRAQLKGCI